MQIVGNAISSLASQAGVDPSGSILHVAVCNGSDSLAVSDNAGKLLASGAPLLGCDAEEFSSVELISSDGPRSTATPKQITQVVAAAIQDASTILQVMRVGTVTVLAAAALMPVRNGFVWDEGKKGFQFEPCLRQVSEGYQVLIVLIWHTVAVAWPVSSIQAAPMVCWSVCIVGGLEHSQKVHMSAACLSLQASSSW